MDRECLIGFRFYENLRATPDGSVPKDNVVMVFGYREPWFMGENEAGEWEFFNSVPAEIAALEDEFSNIINEYARNFGKTG